MIGTTLGHYDVLRKVGSGGMGDVYAARDTKLDREVALKILPPEVAADVERRKRFEREAKAAAKLSHPGIVTLHSVEEQGGEVFITMELVEGKPLAELTSKGPLDLDRMLDLARQIADAVATAHEQGITHRDLKPQNVIVTPDDAAKVLDFGLAKFTEEKADPATTHMATASVTTGDGRILGTPAYMSPEQAEGKTVDHRTDVFSLGIVFYEMATGSRPFEGDSAMSIISSVLKDTPSSISELRTELPARLARIVHRCLVKNPRRRYQSARDLASDLEELRDELKEVGSVSQLQSGAGAAPAKKPLPIWLTIAIIVVAVGAGALGYHLATSAEKSPPPKEKPAPEVERPPVIKRFQRLTTEYGLEIGPQISPDGKWFVYAAGAEKADVYRQRVGGMKRTNLTEGSDVDDWQPAISPDGEQIAFRSERGGGGIYIMGATGESVRRLTDSGFHPAWSPDGKQLVVGTEAMVGPASRGEVSEGWIIEVESGDKRRIEGLPDAPQGTWSPNGRFLAFMSHFGPDEARGLYTTPIEDGEFTQLLEFKDTIKWTPHWSPDGRYIYCSCSTSGVMNIWRLPVDQETGVSTGEPEPVTAGVAMSAIYPSLSSNGKRLLFGVSSPSGNIAKLRFNPTREVVEGSPIMLTRGANGYSALSISPDGEWVAFGSSQVRQDTHENIYVVRSDGTDLRALTQDTGGWNRLPRWASDSERVVFYSHRSQDWEIWSVLRDGSVPRQLTDTPKESTLFGVPARQGTMAVAKNYERGDFLFDIDQPFNDQTLEFLPAHSDLTFWPVDWSPDGSLIVGGMVQGGMEKGLFVYSLRTKEYEKISDKGSTASFLSDSKRVVYAEGSDLKLVDVREQKPKLLGTADADFIYDVSASRDDQWLYFTLVSEDGDVWLAELE